MECTVLKDFPQALSCRETHVHKEGDVIDTENNKFGLDDDKAISWAESGFISFGGLLVSETPLTIDHGLGDVPENVEKSDEEVEWMKMTKAELDKYAEDEHGIKLKRSMSLENMQAGFQEQLENKEAE